MQYNNQQQNQGQRRPQPNNQNPTVQFSEKDFEINNFLSDSGLIDLKLISGTGKGNVKDLAKFLSTDTLGSKKINTNQLRKFYDDFINIYNNLLSYQEKKVQLIMLKAHAEYSSKRLKCDNFNKIFQNRIDVLVNFDNESDFMKNLDAFKLHFEALIGYFPKN